MDLEIAWAFWMPPGPVMVVMLLSASMASGLVCLPFSDREVENA